ncbi:hemerythrin domain-containing protein [Azospirillum sp.]|uniref:hemerythrin domain-containing protein n=1 Tax=Azospirillum sp. TaxID=34012 RepID=UPI002D284BA2|nr:hemerythrin domain-containing protein [Azospirillum sp.]HYD68267.1 hemerythrin domain-containing protein [Azospirillum sp.]
MSTLISTLKREHDELKDLLDRVKALGIGTEEGRRALRAARQVFVDHLAHEDREFYPAFLEAAAGQPDAERMATQFAAEMTAISKEILGFFDRYKDGGSGLEYARDFGKLSAALFMRWHKEENILYARYAQLAARKAA